MLKGTGEEADYVASFQLQKSFSRQLVGQPYGRVISWLFHLTSAQLLDILSHVLAKESDKFYCEFYGKSWRMRIQCVPGPFSSPSKGPGDEASMFNTVQQRRTALTAVTRY